MTILWTPDTCLCIVEIEIVADNPIFINWIQKCQLHKNSSDQALVDQVAIQCRKYKIKKNSTKTENQENNRDKKIEYNKIKAMGAPVKH